MIMKFVKLSTLSLLAMLISSVGLASAQSILTSEGSFHLQSFQSYEVSYPKYNEAFITDNSNNSIDVYNTANPTSPTLVTTIPVLGFNPSYAYIDGSYLYVAEQGETSCNSQCQLIGNYLQIFSINNKKAASPLTLMSSYHSKYAQPDYVVVHKNTAYLADWAGANVEVVSVTNKTDPVLESSLSVTSPTAVAIKGHYAYVGSFSDNSLHIFNIADPSQPETIKTVPLSGASSLVINGDYVYVSDQNDAVNIVGILSPKKAAQVGSISFPANSAPHNLYVDNNNTLYVGLTALSGPSLDTFDLSNPTDPAALQTFTSMGDASSFDTVGSTLYATENNYSSSGGEIQFYSVAE